MGQEQFVSERYPRDNPYDQDALKVSRIFYMTRGGEALKILVILGSPRKGGNTEILADAFIRSAEAAGAQVEKARLTDLEINGCLGCGACKKTGTCRQQDDMTGLSEKLLDVDLWILVTPVYWWGPTSQMKAFVDRWYALQYGPHPGRLKGKRAALISCFADAVEDATPCLVSMLKQSINYLGMEWAGEVLAQAHAKSEVREKPEAIKAAEELGKVLGNQ